jgi:hypothetical protein
MNREIELYISDIDRIHIYSLNYPNRDNGYYRGQRLFAGYSGEDESTRLSLTFGEDFEDYSISVKFSGTNSSGTVYTNTEVKTYDLAAGDMEFEYDIPDTYMVPEVIQMQVVATSDDQTVKSKKIYLEVKRNA